MQKLIHPEEIIVWNILPALRKAIAARMLFSGFKQREIALALGLTESAISQYTKNKRASEVKFSSSLNKEIDFSLELIKQNKSTMFFETQRLLHLKEIRRKVCEFHHSQNKMPNNCEVCFQ